MKPLKYSFTNLERLCQENNIKLCKDYSNVILTRNTKIEGICSTENCNNTFSKNYSSFISNSLCKICINKKRYEKTKTILYNKYGVTNPKQIDDVKNNIPSPVYNITNLILFCDVNNIKLCNDYSDIFLNKYTQIVGCCLTNGCNNLFKKSYCAFVTTNGYCRKCTFNFAII